MKFPPIYLSNFSNSPKGERKGLLKKHHRDRQSPDAPASTLEPRPTKHSVREALLRRLKYNTKPDPFKLFRAQLLPYMEYPTNADIA